MLRSFLLSFFGALTCRLHKILHAHHAASDSLDFDKRLRLRDALAEAVEIAGLLRDSDLSRERALAHFLAAEIFGKAHVASLLHWRVFAQGPKIPQNPGYYRLRLRGPLGSAKVGFLNRGELT